MPHQFSFNDDWKAGAKKQKIDLQPNKTNNLFRQDKTTEIAVTLFEQPGGDTPREDSL